MPNAHTDRFVDRAVSKTVSIYAVFAALWILLSDQVVILLTSDPAQIVLISTMKGWLFVAVTSMLLAYMVRRHLKTLAAANDELRESEVRLRLALEGSRDGVWDWDIPSGTVFFSPRWKEMLGHSEEEIGHGLNEWSDRVCPEDMPKVMADLQLHLDGRSAVYANEHRVRCKDGSYKWILDRGQVVSRDDAGKALRMVGTHVDITGHKEAEARLQLAANVFTHAREGITITDADGIIVEINDAFTRITGYGRDEVLGRNPRLLKSGRQPPEYYIAMWQTLIEKGHWSGEMWNRRKDGEVYAEMITISAVRDASGRTQNYVALFTDITTIKEHQKQLEHIAHYDALTGLPNRVLLADRLQQAMAQSQRRNLSLAVAYVDLDGFKAVNDIHGHEIGDELLIIIAQRMKDALREGDTLARLGGDEFVAVLVDLERPHDCEPVLGRLLQAAADPATVASAALQVSASIGVTLYPQDGADADQLLRHADQAMYQAKQAGKNRYHLFDVAQDAAVKTQRESLEHIRRALARREFVLYYQPKVNMKTGMIVGAEALIRWQHPERGLLPPADFLPVIEDHPLAVDVGEWVIAEALTQMAEWSTAGLDIPVSVNIGARQLQQDYFVPRLAALLAAHPSVHPAKLELEVLETSALEDVLHVSEVMHACREIGVNFALDDFGTGYSSLTYLKRLPAKLLKIDQSFVRDMLEDPEDLAIVEGVVGLAAAFRRNVIAEGVETVAHGELLLPLGCELAQGYGIARPMPAAALPAWVANWRPDATWAAWQGRDANRDDLAVVFVEVEHRHWLHAIEKFLAGDRDVLPPLDAHDCHLGRWQQAEGLARYGEHPEFPVVCDLHERVHALGRELVEMHVHGLQSGAQARLGELRALCGELIARLRGLVRGGGQR